MERTFPCSNSNCIFVHPGGRETTDVCQCLDLFPMPREVRRELASEIRDATTRAFEKGRNSVKENDDKTNYRT